MKLYYSPTSPYVRKVSVTALEKGLDRRIERIPTNVWDPNTEIGTVNPLGKVPTLLTEDGLVLYDSPVICDYLDQIGGEPKLLPEHGHGRWTALRRQALGDGLLDACVARLLEGRRQEHERSASWSARQATVMRRTLDALESEARLLGDGVSLGHIAIACALGYIDFRFAAEDWHLGRPELAEWYRRFAKRPSMQTTIPEDPH